mmetsp:Transcript_58964/g.179866  ORF Transcript_58964/g.179866 Transcript_58964/m.179866 type:complete len:232 (-) Transcript_58964:17-712(-)
MQCKPGFMCAWSTWYQCLFVVFHDSSWPNGRKAPAPSKDVTSRSVRQIDANARCNVGRPRIYHKSSDCPMPRSWMIPSALPAGQPKSFRSSSPHVPTSPRRICPARSLASMKSHSRLQASWTSSGDAAWASTTKPCAARWAFQPSTSAASKRGVSMTRISSSSTLSPRPSSALISRCSCRSSGSAANMARVSARMAATPFAEQSNPNFGSTCACTLKASAAKLPAPPRSPP